MAAGCDEYFDAGGVCLIEWADIIEDIIPDGSILVEIEKGVSETERIYEFHIFSNHTVCVSRRFFEGKEKWAYLL